MPKDFSSKTHAPASGAAETFNTQESGVPKTGFTEAPANERLKGGPGDGVPPSHNKIH